MGRPKAQVKTAAGLRLRIHGQPPTRLYGKLPGKKAKSLKMLRRRAQQLRFLPYVKEWRRPKPNTTGPDRAARVRAIDAWILNLEATYGTSIPVDEIGRAYCR